VDNSGIAGTATPTILGAYQGLDNAQWTVTALSSGEIGVDPGLILRVTDAATGEIIGDYDVGLGYQANTPIDLGGGLSLKLSPGTLVSADAFSVDVVGNPDSSGFLTALGIGMLFQTSDLRNVQVGSEFLSNPNLLAASRSGAPSDAFQLLRLGELRNVPILSNGTETLEERLATLTGGTGVAVNAKQSEVTQLQTQYEQLRNQQDSVSGVDANEELVTMLEFQRAFQASARVMSSVNDALDDLLGLVR
jgi:flagellar hook-associated protein 1 FlgK